MLRKVITQRNFQHLILQSQRTKTPRLTMKLKKKVYMLILILLTKLTKVVA